jgi:hypothetical protein
MILETFWKFLGIVSDWVKVRNWIVARQSSLQFDSLVVKQPLNH